MMKTRTNLVVPMDTDSMSPDSLRAAFDVAITTLADRIERAGDVANWSSLEVALHRPDGATTNLILRTETL